ncbi:hypothetical protein J4217_04965 [Candidatus Pacearchaeota archaeon]|nr:hypothetical protein [Candidatus Pacearchaeota archaeon]
MAKIKNLLTTLTATAVLGLSACATRPYVYFPEQDVGGQKVTYSEKPRWMVISNIGKTNRFMELTTAGDYPSVLSSDYDKPVKLSSVRIWQNGGFIEYNANGRAVINGIGNLKLANDLFDPEPPRLVMDKLDDDSLLVFKLDREGKLYLNEAKEFIKRAEDLFLEKKKEIRKIYDSRLNEKVDNYFPKK